jgi:hypothetical protein
VGGGEVSKYKIYTNAIQRRRPQWRNFFQSHELFVVDDDSGLNFYVISRHSPLAD